MSYREISKLAQGQMGFCHTCPVCNGKACKNTIPGPGAKGSGTVAIANFDAWGQYRLQMNSLHELFEPDTSFDFFGHKLALPVMVGPIGDVERHYGDKFDMPTYNKKMLAAASEFGSLSWTGDGVHEFIHETACEAISALSGQGVCTIKPWDEKRVLAKLELAFKAQVAAVAMDVDAAGLPFLKTLNSPAGYKSAAELDQIARLCHEHSTPFIVKGVLSLAAADALAQTEVDGIVVSNHGGRVLDGAVPTADILPAIADLISDSDLMVLVDGGIRTAQDVFKALALGADAALICRPFAVMMYAQEGEGVKNYLAELQADLADTMQMCGAQSLADINSDMLY